MLNRAHAQRAARFSRLAAQQAAAAFAWDDAIRHYERCLTLVQEADDRLGEDEAALWMQLGVYRRMSGGRNVAGWDAFRRGADAYRRMRDPQAFADGVVAGLPIGTYNVGSLAVVPDVLREALEGVGDRASPAACVLLAYLATVDATDAGDALAERARSMAKALTLPDGLWAWRLWLRDMMALGERGNHEEAVRIGEAWLSEHAGNTSVPATIPGAFMNITALVLGDNGEVGDPGCG